MATKLARELLLAPEKKAKNILVADGSTVITKGLVKSMTIQFAELTAKQEFLVIDEMPVSMIIATSTLKKLEATLNLGHNFVTSKIDDEEVPFSLEQEKSDAINIAGPSNTDSEDLTSESDQESTETSLLDEEQEEKCFVATL